MVEAALVQELATGDALGSGEVLGVELLRDPVGLDEPLPRRALGAVVARVAVLAAQGDADLVGQPLHGLGERQPVDLHDERDDVATLLAAEAVEELALGLTLNDGDFSSWNGQRPFIDPPPALRSVT